MRRSLLAIAVLVGCGKSGAGDPAPAPEPTSATPAGAQLASGATDGKDGGADTKAADKGASATRPKPPVVPPATRKEYRRRLSSGRKLARARKWGEAVIEFERALAAIPMDGRALSELGWAAFQAGDHTKARKANADAVKVTSDTRLKAASLYNLGRVAEAQRDAGAAVRSYLESLALRPNRAVVARLAALGRQPPAPGAPPAEPPCGASVKRDAICACLVQDVEPVEEGETPGCEILEDLATPAGVEIARVDNSSTEHEFFAVVEGKAGWSVVGAVADLYDGGVAGVSNELEWGAIEEKRVGGARLLWVETVVGGYDHDAGINESASHETRTVTVCVLERPGGQAIRPGCPLAVPLTWTYDRDILIEDDEAELTAEEKTLHTPGLPIHRSRKLEVRLADDGTATVVLVEGKADDTVKDLLGSRKLF
jgi:hypothetical protein